MNYQKVNILKLNDSGYPTILRDIPQPPKQLFYRGAAPHSWLERPKVAIVGSRKMTAYGKAVTEKLAGELAHAGVVIISGLALGVDATAHKAALEAGGITTAILGTPVEEISPPSNYGLAERILESKGTILSEFSRGTPGYVGNFVIRNRVVSGLCDILLITEAALKSGSLHTARFALEQGKTVMAVPGSILGPSSEGCNNLIKSGAVPVTDVEDVFFALKIRPGQQKAKLDFKGSPIEERLLKLIREGLADQEQLAVAAGLEGAQIAGSLTSLELQGQIRPTGAGTWLAR